jgi:3alpha(or 20beta)-hydroxysteroid dehydrogenase
VVIVTGAGQGMGAHEARRLIAAGASVVLTDVLSDAVAAVAADLGPRAVARRHDVTDEDDWASVVSFALDTFGGVDTLVNNAAVHRLALIEREKRVEFEQVLAVNLVGTFLGIQAAIAPMRTRGGGSIINISSTAGLTGMPEHAAYGASKFGIVGLTKTAAIELGPSGIRVNSVHPGPINTSMLPPGDATRFAGLPLQRAGEPEEVADLVLFLASDESSFVTGAQLAIDGGMAAQR